MGWPFAHPSDGSMAQETLDNPFSLVYIFQVVRKYTLYIAGVILLALIAAFVFTTPFFYPPEFKAQTIIYPTSSERFDFFNIFHEEPDMYLYGGAKEVEKLDNIANSEEVKLAVIEELGLWEVYGVEKDSESPKYYAFRTYDGNVRTVQESGNGLLIEAYDIDPQRAADMVNLIANKVDEINKRMLDQNKDRIKSMYEEGVQKLRARMYRYEDSTAVLRDSFGVLRSLTQSEVVAEQVLLAQAALGEAQGRYSYLKENAGANATSTKKAREDMAVARSRVRAVSRRSGGGKMSLQSVAEGLDKVKGMEDMLEDMAEDLKNAEERISYLELMTNQDYSTVLVTEQALAADKKARPVRWVIMLATLLAAGLASILGAVLVDRMFTEE